MTKRLSAKEENNPMVIQDKTATTDDKFLPKFRGEAKLYRLNPAFVRTEYLWDDDDGKDLEIPTEYAIVSSAIVLDEPETYIFPANEKGEIQSWSEMDGSQKGTLSHEEVFTDLGYTVVVREN